MKTHKPKLSLSTLLAIISTLTAVAALILIGLDLFDIDDRLNVFDSLGIAFSTVSTGGFSPRADSIAAYVELVQR